MQIRHRMDAKRGNLIWLSDGRTEAAAALDFGIRIDAPGLRGKPNLFTASRTICPTDWRQAGWRIWQAPLVLTGEHAVYCPTAPVACELLADGVCLDRPTWTGFERRSSALSAGRAAVGGAYLTNRNPQTVQAAAWGVCTLRGRTADPFPGGTAGGIRPAASCRSGANVARR